MPGVGAPPPRHLFDEVNGVIAGPDRGRMTAVDGAHRPLDLGYLLECGGDRVGRTGEKPGTFHLPGHALAPPPVRAVRQGRMHTRGPSPAETRPHLIPAVTGSVQVVLHDIQGLLAAGHELLVGRGRVEAERPQNLRHQLHRIQGGTVPALETLGFCGKRLTEPNRLSPPATSARGTTA